MPEPTPSRFDLYLDRAAKIAGILLPAALAAAGWWVTAHQDARDQAAREAADKRDITQKQYSNLVALLPLLTSDKPSEVAAGLEVFTAEAAAGQAPLELMSTITRIAKEQPKVADAAQGALEAAKSQQSKACRYPADGLYLHVANSEEQLASGKKLAGLLQAANIMQVHGVERVDAVPASTEIRFYFSPENDAKAARIEDGLRASGFDAIKRQDLSRMFLKSGCPPPGVFEVWIGSATPLSESGQPKN